VDVVEYSDAFKAKMVRKMLPPGAVSANALAAETGLNQSTLSRWLKEARTVGVMDKPTKTWTLLEKLRVVVEASRIKDADLGEFLRREGIHEAELNEWREAAAAGFSAAPRPKKHTKEAKRIKELEREVRRKDKALAEASALLILKKKVEAIWGGVDDDTTEENDS
jgi:transposase-like protein